MEEEYEGEGNAGSTVMGPVRGSPKVVGADNTRTGGPTTSAAAGAVAPGSQCRHEREPFEAELPHDQGTTKTGGAEAGWPRAPETYEGWLSLLSEAQNMRQLGILLAWGFSKGHMLFGAKGAGPQRSPAKAARKGELFPLPVNWPPNFSTDWQPKAASSCTVFSADCWVVCARVALNSLYGFSQVETARRPGKVHQQALLGLRDRVERFLAGDGGWSFSFDEIVKDLKEKRVSYTGEEVSRPLCLTPPQIEKSLPPVGHGGSIPVSKFLRGRTKFLVENPLENLVPVRERSKGPMQAKVHIARGQELEVFKLLESRGVITWIRASEVFSDSAGECLNGMFGVIKPGKFTTSGLPILRVIMNLVPANRLLEVIQGDVGLLPHGAAWMTLVCSGGEELRVSQADMAAAFYLFALPAAWYPFMAFNFVASGEQIGQKAVNASTPTRSFWQVYLDNFMAAEHVQGDYTEMDVKLQEIAMNAWRSAGVLTAEDKQVLGAPCAVELGVRLDGSAGLLGASAERVMRTALSTVRLLQLHGGSIKDAQIVLGRWIFILQYRRAGMAVLARAWEALEERWAMRRHVNNLLKELQMLLCLAPLLQTDMRCDFDASVTCSDASETGGAAALSTGLTWSGQTLVHSLQGFNRRPLEVPILVISFFNGVGGAFRIYDVLGLVPVGRISVEISKEANRVTRTAWPSVEEYLDIEDLRKDPQGSS